MISLPSLPKPREQGPCNSRAEERAGSRPLVDNNSAPRLASQDEAALQNQQYTVKPIVQSTSTKSNILLNILVSGHSPHIIDATIITSQAWNTYTC